MFNTLFKATGNLIADHQHVHYMNAWFQTYSDQSLGKQATPTRPKLSNASGYD